MATQSEGTEKICLDEIVSLNKAAERCKNNGDLKGALNKLSAALKRTDVAGLTAIRAEILNNIGHIQVALGWLNAALTSFKESAVVYGSTGDQLGCGHQFGNVGSVYRDLKEYNEALGSYYQAISCFRKEKYQAGLADQFGNVGYIYAMRGDPVKATEWYEKAAKLYMAAGEKEQFCLVKNNIRAITVNQRLV
ncbi:MAG: tetratricopeptide repeat protein [Desulfosarcina sp.]|nr:tetratricopeptide repeat protein [Desulfobacterales bacterium]